MKNEVSIKLQGGMGNYIFQIANAYVYSLKYDKDVIVSTDDAIIIHKQLDVYKDNIFRNVNLVTQKNYNDFLIYNEPFFNYSEIPKMGGSVYLNGYFQSEQYFKGYEKEVKHFFSLPDNIINSVKEKYKNELEKNTCAVHVRRGDYLNLPNHHPAQSINYYMKAIKQMPEDSVFLIFSDDIPWCKESFPNIEDKFIFIEGNKDYEDLLLMSLCKNNIIANSSFSWWGAWLNGNSDKKVIAPSKWFGSANSNNNTVDLYCENWIVI